jgi:hypothetical protein
MRRCEGGRTEWHVTVEMPGPPFVVTCGTGPVGAEHPSDRTVIALGPAAHASQMPRRGEGVERGPYRLLPVQRQLLGKGLRVHRGTLGEPVHEPGDVRLAGGQVIEVAGPGGLLIRSGSLAVAGLGWGVRARAGQR